MDRLFLYFRQFCTLDFWQGLFAAFQASGPVVAVSLAMIESFFPALPLTAIAVLNVAAYGFLPGFLCTWVGSCLGCTITFLFFRYGYGVVSRIFSSRRGAYGEAVADGMVNASGEDTSAGGDKASGNAAKIRLAREKISGFDTVGLFLILCLPFTPSSFMNFAFGVSDYPIRKYLLTLYVAKILMIGSLSLFGDGVTSFWKNPLRLVLVLSLMGLLYYLSVRVRKKHQL